jgi:meiosis arrest female protein 1
MCHYKAPENKGWAEIKIDPLPNVMMSIAQVQAMIQPLLRTHKGDVPIASLLYCLEELNVTVATDERGVSLEHPLIASRASASRTTITGLRFLLGATTRESMVSSTLINLKVLM